MKIEDHINVFKIVEVNCAKRSNFNIKVFSSPGILADFAFI